VFTFDAGAGHYVELSDATADGELVLADAVRFEFVSN
jgi:leucyl aminopeptidase